VVSGSAARTARRLRPLPTLQRLGGTGIGFLVLGAPVAQGFQRDLLVGDGAQHEAARAEHGELAVAIVQDGQAVLAEITIESVHGLTLRQTGVSEQIALVGRRRGRLGAGLGRGDAARGAGGGTNPPSPSITASRSPLLNFRFTRSPETRSAAERASVPSPLRTKAKPSSSGRSGFSDWRSFSRPGQAVGVPLQAAIARRVQALPQGGQAGMLGDAVGGAAGGQVQATAQVAQAVGLDRRAGGSGPPASGAR
jgi:hypothetical protein